MIATRAEQGRTRDVAQSLQIRRQGSQVHTSKDELNVMLQRANEMTEGPGLHHFTNLTFDEGGDGVGCEAI